MIWLAIGGALFISGIVSYALSRYRGRWAILDPVNARSLHAMPVPRVGGVAILLGIFFAAVLELWKEDSAPPVVSLVLIILALVLVATISLLDDVRGLGVVSRLVGQLAAALLVAAAGLYLNVFVFGGWSFQPGTVAGIVVAVLFMLWLTNLYNFMDGMDGLAAGMGVLGFGAFALLGALAGHAEFSQVNAGIAAACLGFLLFNFPPAKIFMGDVGSASLGFLAAIMMLWANRQNVFPIWIGIVVFSPFIVDASWTLVRRTVHGQKPWQAHREHFYQRLVLGGWSRRRTLGWEYALMMLCVLVALGLEHRSTVVIKYALLVGLGAIYLGLIAVINVLDAGRRGRSAA